MGQVRQRATHRRRVLAGCWGAEGGRLVWAESEVRCTFLEQLVQRGQSGPWADRDMIERLWETGSTELQA